MIEIPICIVARTKPSLCRMLGVYVKGQRGVGIHTTTPRGFMHQACAPLSETGLFGFDMDQYSFGSALQRFYIMLIMRCKLLIIILFTKYFFAQILCHWSIFNQVNYSDHHLADAGNIRLPTLSGPSGDTP